MIHCLAALSAANIAALFAMYISSTELAKYNFTNPEILSMLPLNKVGNILA